ncbi:hypothetical protein VTL71DRAFT_6290 [Oculimacula yallundae]|uniref:Arrestin-like N-terminal domain-containing protein n=1 Tax=Oculimacula yallundae TaxID=86028 RepID=A0ABR4BWK0_9HELO
MKVTIQLDRTAVDHDRRFTSTDYVRGNVVLSLQRADAVSRITVELSGSLLSSVVAAATNPLDGTLHALNTHKLFDICQPVFPPPDLPISTKGFSLSKGTSTFPFVLRFPLISTCSDTNHDWIKHLNTSLPPSIKVQAPNSAASAEAKYALKVKVERPGRFKPDVTSQLDLDFMPLDPTLPPPMLNPVSARTSRSLLRTFSGTSPPSSPPVTSRLDNSVITFEASLPSPAILHTTHRLPLSILAFIKSASQIEGSTVFLRSLYLSLRTETIVTVGPNSTSWLSSEELVNVSDLNIELGDVSVGTGRLEDSLWKDVAVPKMTPSFTSCTLIQQHFLVVCGGFSYGMDGQIQIIKTSINVDIHTGIKPECVSLESGQEGAPFVPWRVGSERHLGIMRRSDSIVTNEPPPAYS